MKKMTVSMAAALVLGVLATPAAQAGCDPVYDPGAACPGRFKIDPEPLPGGLIHAEGKFSTAQNVTLESGTYVKDTADDGLDVHLWVSYGPLSGARTQEPIAVASGLGARTDVEWTSPAGAFVHVFQVRVCVGAGEDNCGRWVG